MCEITACAPVIQLVLVFGPQVVGPRCHMVGSYGDLDLVRALLFKTVIERMPREKSNIRSRGLDEG